MGGSRKSTPRSQSISIRGRDYEAFWKSLRDGDTRMHVKEKPDIIGRHGKTPSGTNSCFRYSQFPESPARDASRECSHTYFPPRVRSWRANQKPSPYSTYRAMDILRVVAGLQCCIVRVLSTREPLHCSVINQKCYP